MSSIDKLLIRGIRSFSPDEPTVIEFFAPVTLIVGQNGAGKTTIIECLKYATTGDLPPNSKGGNAFVHDCRVYGATEIKAQVKLKFRSVLGQPLVVTRSLQLTAKGARTECKTLEGVLVTTDPHSGEQVSLSSRVAELDLEVPLHLGVSPAVLDNVIFCHQEDSLWPLAEPSHLKKKFDEIFAATRYTKALDCLKALRKQLLADLKLEQQRLEQCKSDRDKANRLRALADSTASQLQEAQARVTALQSLIDDSVLEMSTLGEQVRMVGAVTMDFERHGHDLTSLDNAVAELRASGMRELADLSDAEMAALWEQHAKVADTALHHQDTLKERKDQLTMQVGELQRSRNDLQVQLGTHKAQAERLAQQWTTLSGKYGLQDPTQLGDFLAEQQATVRALEANITDKEAAHQALAQQLQQEMGHLQLQHSALGEARRHVQRQQDELRLKLADMMRRRDLLTQSSGDSSLDLQELEQLLHQEGLALKKAENDLTSVNYDARLADLTRQRREQEDAVQTLNDALTRAARSVDLGAKLHLKQDECARKADAIQRAFKDLVTEAAKLGLGDLTLETFEGVADRVQGERERASKQAALEELDVQGQIQRLRNELVASQRLLHDKQTQLAALECPEDVGRQLEDLENRLGAFHAHRASVNAVNEVYNGFIERLNAASDCPLCERPFATCVEIEQMLARLRHSTQSQLKVDNCQELEAKRGLLKTLKPVHDQRQVLMTVDLPRLQELAVNHQETLRVLNQQLDQIASHKAAAHLDEQRATILKRRAEELGRLMREHRLIVTQLATLRSGLEGDLGSINPADNNDICSFEHIQAKLQETQGQLRQGQQHVESVHTEQRLCQADVSRRQLRVRDLKAQVLTVQMLSAEAATLQTQIQAAERDLLPRLKGEGEEVEREILALAEHMDVLEQDQVARSGQAKAAVDDARAAFHRGLERLQALRLEARDFDQRDGRGGIMRCMEGEEKMDVLLGEEIADLDRKLEHLNQALSNVADGLVRQGREAAEREMAARHIRDNQRLREMAAKRSVLEHKMHDLRNQLRGRVPKAELTAQLQRGQLRHSDLLGERSGVLGELRQLEEQQRRLTRELQTEYPDADATYRAQFGKCVAATVAAEDLERYARTLDSAIMRYHATKMDDINRIIRELWMAIYQGADIDTIEIRADSESMHVNSNTNASSQSYKYRVVMIVKGGDGEMDMRGRSSAGQRVLASLVIRLALAETFALQCGLLALDEPTTNLDRENIEALAQALGNLVKGRRRQSNFQLLIITHDEDFVALLGRHQCADHYWRVEKDAQQCSVIERQSMSTF